MQFKSEGWYKEESRRYCPHLPGLILAHKQVFPDLFTSTLMHHALVPGMRKRSVCELQCCRACVKCLHAAQVDLLACRIETHPLACPMSSTTGAAAATPARCCSRWSTWKHTALFRGEGRQSGATNGGSGGTKHLWHTAIWCPQIPLHHQPFLLPSCHSYSMSLA